MPCCVYLLQRVTPVYGDVHRCTPTFKEGFCNHDVHGVILYQQDFQSGEWLVVTHFKIFCLLRLNQDTCLLENMIEEKVRSFSGLTLNLQGGVSQLQNSFGDGEPQPRTT